ncbi:DUF2059 domain-containing protein [Thalassovita mangrovi]|uniref:DUF2059 domain-containing protein n=1 Tax=Thalassovita mangrovi TaxID=2692236 RepID=A0A6L8LPD1_9RHOB|nr:DUF2059 domain-containing protein [Thalassovita mangrovi]MYM57473.1 DUF2059 domain-containing protein [Thalassovita mangrovi]
MTHKYLLLAAFTAFSAPTVVLSDATEDATRIAEVTVTDELFQAAFRVQGPIIANAMENQLRNIGIQISDPEAFTKIVIEEMLAEITLDMQKAMVDYYLTNFSSDDLTGIRSFYESSPGRALLKKTPELMEFSAKQGAIAGQKAARAAGDRIADRIERERIQITEPSMLQKLLRALRN